MELPSPSRRTFNVYLPEDVAMWVQNHAKKMNLRISPALRILLERAMNDELGKVEPPKEPKYEKA